MKGRSNLQSIVGLSIYRMFFSCIATCNQLPSIPFNAACSTVNFCTPLQKLERMTFNKKELPTPLIINFQASLSPFFSKKALFIYYNLVDEFVASQKSSNSEGETIQSTRFFQNANNQTDFTIWAQMLLSLRRGSQPALLYLDFAHIECCIVIRQDGRKNTESGIGISCHEISNCISWSSTKLFPTVGNLFRSCLICFHNVVNLQDKVSSDWRTWMRMNESPSIIMLGLFISAARMSAQCNPQSFTSNWSHLSICTENAGPGDYALSLLFRPTPTYAPDKCTKP